MNSLSYPQLEANPSQFSSLDSINQFDFNLFQSPISPLDHHHPIDPRLKTQDFITTTQSDFEKNLDPTHAEFLSHFTSQSLSPETEPETETDLEPETETERVTKRAKFNFENQHHPSFESPLDNHQTHWKRTEIDDQIEALMGDSLNTQSIPHDSHPQELSISKSTLSSSIQSTENTYIINHHTHTLDQSFDRHSPPPPPSISTLLLDTQNSQDKNTQCDQFLLDPPPLPPIPSSSISEPAIDPSLENLHPSLLISSFAFAPSSPCDPVLQSGCVEKNQPQNISQPTPHSPSSTSLIYSNLSQVDVHGAGAGGGAAAVLEAQHQHIKDPSAFTVNWRKDSIIKHKKQIREKPSSKSSSSHQSGPNNNRFDLKLSPTLASYNPDQFRSWNRIHWTPEEEQLLLKEVELHWHHYDCMAQIMKRHGPKGTISTTFADRTGASLKDKAVNISSRWYRDGTEISSLRRQAFARFRPKQLRGKPKCDFPGMIQISHFLNSSKSSSSSNNILEDHHQLN